MSLEKVKTELNVFLAQKRDIAEQVEILNCIREVLHNHSPFKMEPVDFVRWVPGEHVVANEYNPNSVAPPEMKLLELSILSDGYTQPIVAWENEDKIEVVDGFHRNRVGKESKEVKTRIHGYLPVVGIKEDRAGKNDRIASTIRHNRARGKHAVSSMSDIVIELKNRNWTNVRIGKELGMDEDEVLRLCQITGLSDLFKDDDFSRSWNVEDIDEDFVDFTGDVSEDEKQQYLFRTINTSDPERIFHTYDKWECHKYGFYDSTKEGMTKEECEREYAVLLADESAFREALEHVISEWKYSCEHYLTNKAMNRIAWLGQAALAYAKKIPSAFRGGFHLLSTKQQEKANRIAHEYLNKWLENNSRPFVSFEDAISDGRQVEIY